MGDAQKNTKKVEKAVTGHTVITEDDNKQHKLLLGLGCLLTAGGSALTGWAANKVDKCKCVLPGVCGMHSGSECSTSAEASAKA
jgi:hypothetical protein